MNPNTWWSAFGTLEVLFQSKPHVPHVLVSERCLRWINGWGETPKIHSLPPFHPPQQKKGEHPKKKTTLRFRNHGIIDGQLWNSFSLPHLLKERLASVVQAGHLKQPSEAESKAALLKGTGGTEVMCWVRDQLKLWPLSKDVWCVSSWKRWNSWQHKICANRDQRLGGWSQRWFHCSPESFIAATSSCCFFLNQKIPQRATVPIWGFPKLGYPKMDGL